VNESQIEMNFGLCVKTAIAHHEVELSGLKMLFLINIPLAIATVLYSSYVYMSLDQNMLGIWHLMFYPSITLILQTCVCFSSLTLAYPCILYDITEYRRPMSVAVVSYILTAILVLVVAKILVLSILYVDSVQGQCYNGAVSDHFLPGDRSHSGQFLHYLTAILRWLGLL